jgi:Ni/Co efflux regulator RcnB
MSDGLMAQEHPELALARRSRDKRVRTPRVPTDEKKKSCAKVRRVLQNWRRGDRLSQYHRSQYREVDWRRERLRQPPRGYHYVRDDRGEVLLVGIATGVILSILLSQ